MLNWKNTNRYEQRMQEVLNEVYRHSSGFLDNLFDREVPRLRLDAEWLLLEAAKLSNADMMLIRVGLDLWNGTGGVRLWEIIEGLDVYNFQAVVAGLRHLRQNNDEEEGIVWRQRKMAYFPKGRRSHPVANDN